MVSGWPGDDPVEVALQLAADEDRGDDQREEGEPAQAPLQVEVAQSGNQPGREHRHHRISLRPDGRLGGVRRGSAAGFGQSVLLSSEERPQALPRLAQVLGHSRTSASTVMKFVSPFQRGTRWKWKCPGTPAPAGVPRFIPRLKPWGL